MSAPLTLSAGSSRLLITPEGRLEFQVGDAAPWVGNGPLCILHYYDRQHPRAQSVPVPWQEAHGYGTPGTASLSPTSEVAFAQPDPLTILATVKMPGQFISFTLRFALRGDGGGFTVAISEVGESHRLYRILAIEVLPGFGAAATGEPGYLTLPNWSGCQTFFDKDYPREVRQSVYSSNDEWEHVCNMPVFGITRDHGTLCGILARGDYDAQLVCRVHWEREHANGVHPQFVYRWQQQDELIPGPREIRYSFAAKVHPAGEGYAFCGGEYRRFLRAERTLQSWDEKAALRPEAGDFRGRFFLKIFMAYKDPHPEGTGAYHSTCTIAEAQQIIERCLASGMRKLAVTLVGWGQDGHDGKCPTYLPVDDRVGGDEAMRGLISWCRAHDVMLGVHTSHNAAYPCSDEFDPADLVRHRTGEYWESVIWSGGQAHLLCPSIFVERDARRELDGLAALGFHGHHHFDAVGSFMTCHDPAHPVTSREAFAGLVRQQFAMAHATMGSVSTEMPFGPYFGMVDGFFASYQQPYPWHRASTVGRWFLDRSVPLLTCVVHGSISCCQAGAGTRRDLLTALANGNTPQCEVCMRPSPVFGIPAYDWVADRLPEVYRFFYGPDGVTTRLGRHWITSHRQIVPDVTETIYSDGSRVLVNLSPNPFAGIPAEDFRIERSALAAAGVG